MSPPAPESQAALPERVTQTVTEAVTAVDSRELSRVPDTLAVTRALRGRGLPWWLDSAMPSERLGRFSFVGADPYLVVRAWGREAQLECRRPVRPGLAVGTTECVADPFELVRAWMPAFDAAEAAGQGALPPVPFVGGAVGYFGYELATCVEALELRARDDLGLPDLLLLFVDRLVAVDHELGRAWAIGLGFGPDETTARANAGGASRDMESLAASVPAAATPATLAKRRRVSRSSGPGPVGLDAFFDADSYASAVEEIRDEIAAGNVYQANLTQRMDLDVPGADALALYTTLRGLNPAPFAAYLELPEVAILSSSPERFLRLSGPRDGRRVESRPIKGTRPRGASDDEDRRLGCELAASEKDRAENLMIVDLVRNDLGRVCELASIDVPELMQIEPYATVFQMVSSVTGTLRPDCDVVDLVRASFPPGSMTGAPKLAAMRVIDRLEPVRRGVYSGALGYLDVRGGSDLSVVIRTLLVARGRAYLHAGGGIVADSDPAAEYRETLDKARALLAALARGALPPIVEATAETLPTTVSGSG